MQTTPRRVTIQTLRQMKAKGERIAMLTAYDATFARLLDEAGADVLLVGDSLGMAFCSGEIYVMDADGSKLRRLTHTPGVDRSSNPDWSPDGQQILFASTRDGKVHNWDESEIYVMASDGTNVRRLTRTPGKGNWTPRWHPDGKKIIFASNRGAESAERSEIYVMHADGSNVRQLTTHERLAARPHWSPDGKKVVYHHGNSKDWSDHEIYVMDADGSNVRRLTFNKAIDGHPAW